MSIPTSFMGKTADQIDSSITKHSRSGWYSMYFSGTSFEYNPYLLDETQAFKRLNAYRQPLIEVYVFSGGSLAGCWVVCYSLILGASGKVVYSTMSLDDAFEFAEDFVLLEAQARLVQFKEFGL